MTLPLPELDDRRYDDLVEEIISLIPRYAPAWTDHNPSDPGIMLIELFAWLFESMMYRQNRVTLASERTFLKLLNGHLDGTVDDMSGLDLKQARAKTIQNLRTRFRAITADDFETLVLAMDEPKMARVKCLAGLNLEAEDPETPRTGHVSLILVPHTTDDRVRTPVPAPVDMEKVFDHLNQRRLITTRVHVVAPVYVKICLDVVVAARTRESQTELKSRVADALRRFFHPLYGGYDGHGWPFGRSVHASEVYQLIEGLSGVDYVDSLILYKMDGGEFKDSGTEIDINPNALVDYDEDNGINAIRILNSYE
ncbi:MAG: hypothetical protein WC799_03455 [Desulfobacteraceae bacterium]|jgi:hypothetical protein